MKEIRKDRKYFQVFSGLFLFSGIEPSSVEKAFTMENCTCIQFEAGETVYTRTKFKHSLGLVLSGALKAVKAGGTNAEVVLNTFFTGGVFGAASLFQQSDSYVAEIIAVKRSRILWLPEEMLRMLFLTDCCMAENYIRYLSGRISFLNERIDCFTGGTAQGRLEAFFWDLCQNCQGRPCVVSLPCSMVCLAETLGISRASLYRAIDSLVGKGVASRRGKEFVFTNPEQLKPGK